MTNIRKYSNIRKMYNNIIDFEPEQLHTLTGSEQIKAYVHPTRIMLLRLLAKERRTISSIAKENGVHPANITHHFRLLEKAGLIRLVGKRDTGKNLERYYRAIAYNFIVRPEAKHGRKDTNKKALALSILKDNLSVAIKTVKDDDGDNVLALLNVTRLTPEDVKKLMKRLNGVVSEFRKYDSPDGKLFTINVSLYPNDTSSMTPPGEEIIL